MLCVLLFSLKKIEKYHKNPNFDIFFNKENFFLITETITKGSFFPNRVLYKTQKVSEPKAISLFFYITSYNTTTLPNKRTQCFVEGYTFILTHIGNSTLASSCNCLQERHHELHLSIFIDFGEQRNVEEE